MCLNGLVAKSERAKFNLSLPAVVMREYEAEAARMPRGGKGMVVTAAMVAFLSAPQAERERLLKLVGAAEGTGDWSEVLAQIRGTGEVRITNIYPGGEDREGFDVVGDPKQRPPQSSSAKVPGKRRKRNDSRSTATSAKPGGPAHAPADHR